MAVSNETGIFNLYVKEGSVNYVINNNSRKIAFHTPEGTYTVAEVVFDANSGSVVKGSVSVASNGQTEISVTEGRMIFATADGMKAVDANNKLVLAQSTIPAGTAPAAGLSTTTMVVAGLGVALLATAIVINASDDDDDGGGVPGGGGDNLPGGGGGGGVPGGGDDTVIDSPGS